MSGRAAPGETVVRRSGRGWVVGDEEASDLTSAMVLADLLAADLASSGPAAQGPAAQGPAASTTESTTTGGARAGASAADTPADGGSAPPVPKAVPRHARPMNEAGEADEAARLRFPGHDGASRGMPGCQVPRKMGWRFSANALRPSR